MRKERILTINKNDCDKCNLCVESCPVNIIELREEGAELVSQNCMKCGKCVTACPRGLITLTGFQEELVEDENGLKIDPNELVKQLKQSSAVRQFADTEVSREHIETIIKSGKEACVGKNVSCVVVQKNIPTYEKLALETINNIKNIAGKFLSAINKVNIDEGYLFRKANLVIVVKSDDKKLGLLVAKEMEGTAGSLGLGIFNCTLFSAIANKSLKLKKFLKVDKNEKIVTTLVLGYPKTK